VCPDICVICIYFLPKRSLTETRKLHQTEAAKQILHLPIRSDTVEKYKYDVLVDDNLLLVVHSHLAAFMENLDKLKMPAKNYVKEKCLLYFHVCENTIVY